MLFRSTISGKIFLKGLAQKLKELRPDAVQAFDAFSFLTLQGAFLKQFYNYKFFTANHIVASVFPLYKKESSTFLHKLIFYFTRTIPGMMVSLVTSRCYPATIDALEIAVKYYGVPDRKAKLACLGVDTDFFKPDFSNDQIINRKKIRIEYGLSETDLLCIYTGRFTEIGRASWRERV